MPKFADCLAETTWCPACSPPTRRMANCRTGTCMRCSLWENYALLARLERGDGTLRPSVQHCEFSGASSDDNSTPWSDLQQYHAMGNGIESITSAFPTACTQSRIPSLTPVKGIQIPPRQSLYAR